MVELKTLVKQISSELSALDKFYREALEKRIGQIYELDLNHLTDTVQNALTGESRQHGGGLKGLAVSQHIVGATKGKAKVPVPELVGLDLKTDADWNKKLNEYVQLAAKKEKESIKRLLSENLKPLRLPNRIRRVLGELNLNSPAAKRARFKTLARVKRNLRKSTGNRHIFIFFNHDTGVKFQNELTKDIQLFLLQIVQKTVNVKSKEYTQKQGYISQRTTQLFNVGHGGGTGAAAAAIRISSVGAERAAFLEQSGQATTAEEVRRAVKEAQHAFAVAGYERKGISIPVGTQQQFVEIVNNYYIDAHTGKFKEDFVTVISLQSSIENNIDAIDERAASQAFALRMAESYPNIAGSPTTAQVFMSSIMRAMTYKLKFTKITGTEKLSNKGVRKASTSVNSNATLKMQDESARFRSSPILLENRTTASKNLGALDLVAYINARITRKIIENMGTPALVNRTGRFAQSVIATDATIGDQGVPVVGFSYQTHPYAVFDPELGRVPWATSERDPSALIDKSIREIAAEVYKGTVITRRR